MVVTSACTRFGLLFLSSYSFAFLSATPFAEDWLVLRKEFLRPTETFYKSIRRFQTDVPDWVQVKEKRSISPIYYYHCAAAKLRQDLKIRSQSQCRDYDTTATWAQPRRRSLERRKIRLNEKRTKEGVDSD